MIDSILWHMWVVHFFMHAQVQAAAAIGVLASANGNRKAIADAGGIPCLVSLLASSCSEAQETAAAAVWTLAFDGDCRRAIVAAHGIQALIQLLQSNSSCALQEHAAGGENDGQRQVTPTRSQPGSL